MRPQLRSDAFFAPVAHGVIWLSSAGEVTLKGTSIAAVTQRLAPHLNGRRTVEELTATLSDQHRSLVVELIDVLLAKGLVRDAAAEQPSALYVTGDAVYERFAGGRALVAAPGPMVAACVRALSRGGVRKVTARIDARDQDTEGTPDGRVQSDVLDDAVDNDGLESVDFVLHLFDCERIGHARRLAALCARRDIPLVQALVSAAEVLIGPHPALDWETVWRRLAPEDRHAFRTARMPPMSGACLPVLANHLAFLLYRQVTGTSGAADSRLHVFDTGTLERTSHRVLPLPPPTGSVRRSRERFEASVRRLRAGRRLTEEELSTRVMAAIDERFGPIRRLDEADLPQLPLRQTRAVVADPFSADRVEVTAYGPNFRSARHRAALKSVGTYGVLASGPHLPQAGSRRARWGLRLGPDEPRLVDVDGAPGAIGDQEVGVGVGVGLDWGQMVTAAVLARYQADLFTGSDGMSSLIDRPCPSIDEKAVASDPAVRRYHRLLGALGHDVCLYDLTGAAGVPTVGCALDGAVLHVESALSWTAAARGVIEYVLAAAQSGVLPGAVLAEPAACGGTWKPPRDITPADVIAAIRGTGREPVLILLDDDPAMAQVLPYAGRVVLLDE
ncbi:hypothetical protein FE633_32530 [Streptomyces montanus]|uniref:YcaO domain-containing protein n=1 Tax=Streptomyces montanus TaxID=2580423 RepID=A0A5R9FIW1_9ACTN|nr:hypothetical protein [Streptomyces montanus]TLS42106.1 hypothetical protein FE633_32530 [Streptomyces montanus]